MTASARTVPGWGELLGLVALALVLGVVGVLQPDHIRINAGTGADGLKYATLVVKGHEAGSFWRQNLDDHLFARLFPSWVVHEALSWTGRTPTPSRIVRVFAVFNVLLLALTAAGFFAACRLLRVGRVGFWVTGFGLLVNFGLWKWSGSYPVLTDAWAVAMSMWMVVAWLAGWSWAIVGLSILGAFTWPILPIQGLCLLLAPRGVGVDSGHGGAALVLLRATVGLVVAAAAMAVLGFLLTYNARLLSPGVPAPIVAALTLDQVPFFAWFNIGCLGLLFGAAAASVAYLPRFQGGWDLRALARIGLQVALVLAVPRLVHVLLHPGPSYINARLYLVVTSFFAVRQPLAPLVFFPFFFGSLAVLALLKWGEVVEQVRRLGLGMALALLAGVAFSYDAEPRHHLHFFPLLAVLLAPVLGRYVWNGWQLGLFALVCLFLSRIWLPLDDIGTLWFSFGWAPFLSNDFYLMQATVVVLVGGLFAHTLCRTPQPPPAPEAGHRPLARAA